MSFFKEIFYNAIDRYTRHIASGVGTARLSHRKRPAIYKTDDIALERAEQKRARRRLRNLRHVDAGGYDDRCAVAGNWDMTLPGICPACGNMQPDQQAKVCAFCGGAV